jgi:WD40 repeat protein
MKLFRSLAVLSAIIALMFLYESVSSGAPAPDNKPGQSIFGTWQADAVSIMVTPGQKLVYPSFTDNRPFSVIITDKSLALWRAGKVFAEMKYDAKTQLTAKTINGECQNEGVLGIYELKDNLLKMSLNNVNGGRPENYERKDNDCVLVLRRFNSQPLMIIDTEDNSIKPLAALPNYTGCGSPFWSQDGKKIAFDCWRSIFNENYTRSHVFTINSDGTSPKDLGDGCTPSFSPDGKQIAFCRYNENAGFWIMNSDGSGKRLIDKKGACVRWSPKGDQLAYSISGGNICLLDLKTDQRRNLLEKNYKQIVWGFCWSPDAKWICFKGTLPNESAETAIVSAEGQSKGLHVLAPNAATPELKSTESSFSWSPDGKKILTAAKLGGDINCQLYYLDPKAKIPPKKLAGQDPNCQNYCSAWSPDGKKIVLGFWLGTTPQNTGSGSRNIFKKLLGL